jgi:type II secretory pathway component PulJ
MGTSSIIDIIASAVVAGLLLLIALRLNAQANETSMIYNGSVTLQQNMVTLVGMLEHDFRQIGYCKTYSKIPDPSKSIRKADTSDITFWTDVNNTGNLDSVRWYVGPTSEMSSSPNPRDRMIYRVVNNSAPVGWNLGVTQFKLEYYEYDGDTIKVLPVAQPGSIYSMQISLACESPVPFAEQYRTQARHDSLADFQVFWRQLRLAARNLKNR